MTATLPSLDQVEKIAKALAPDVVRIRMHVGHDWTEDPAIYFRVILSDDASRLDRLHQVTKNVRARLFEELGLSESDRIPYFRFRSWSEQEQFQDRSWA